QNAGVTQVVIREERLSVATSCGHALTRTKRPLRLRQIAAEPLILYPCASRPSYADQVLSFYSDLELAPNVAFEVRELQTAWGLVAAGAGISLVPSSVQRLGRSDIEYLELDEPAVVSPIIVSHRTNDQSSLLAAILSLLDEWGGRALLGRATS